MEKEMILVKDVVIKAREMIVVNPNERYSMPDEIATILVSRGKAEIIGPVTIEKKAKGGK
jgi:hypothetical protein